MSAAAAAPGHAMGAMGELYGALWRHAEGTRGQLLGATALLTGSQLLRLTMPWLAGAGHQRAADAATSRAAGRWIAALAGDLRAVVGDARAGSHPGAQRRPARARGAGRRALRPHRRRAARLARRPPLRRAAAPRAPGEPCAVGLRAEPVHLPHEHRQLRRAADSAHAAVAHQRDDRDHWLRGDRDRHRALRPRADAARAHRERCRPALRGRAARLPRQCLDRDRPAARRPPRACCWAGAWRRSRRRSSARWC